MQNFITLQQALKRKSVEYMERIKTLLSSYTNNNDIYRNFQLHNADLFRHPVGKITQDSEVPVNKYMDKCKLTVNIRTRGFKIPASISTKFFF